MQYNWFTVEKIDAQTFAISEYKHWEETHCYLRCCFYEQDRGWLYSGDLIYKGCLDAFYPTTDPIAFMHSVEKVRLLKIKKVLPAHHQLNISVSLVNEIAKAFQSLYQQGKLRQGNGVFAFGEFQIHI